MKMFRYILSVPLLLNITLVVAILSVIIIDMYLKNMPEIVPWGNEFSEIYYRLCLSLFASYIFYFIVVHIKLERDKENVNVFISSKVFQIIGEYKAQINAIKKEVNSEILDEYLNEIALENMFQQINTQSKAPLVLSNVGNTVNYANWMKYFSYHNVRIQTTIQKIFVHMPFLDSKLVSILAHIDDCNHFTVVDLLSNMHLNQNMKSFASTFHGYSILCEELEEYANIKLVKYKKT